MSKGTPRMQVEKVTGAAVEDTAAQSACEMPAWLRTVKEEAAEISQLVETGATDGLAVRYEKFSKTYPSLFKDLVDGSKSIEQINVYLDSFNIALSASNDIGKSIQKK
jgi:hypothetical protein